MQCAGNRNVDGTHEVHPVVDDVDVELVQAFGYRGGDVSGELA